MPKIKKKEFKLTFDLMKSKGWKFDNNGTCNNCGDEIEWWESPKGNPAPFNPMNKGSDEAIFHSKVCSGK